MAQAKLRVGIIGIGWYAAIALVPAFRETGRAEIVAVARRNPERLALAQAELNIPHAYIDWKKMLEQEELDAIVVSTPGHLHAEPTIAALDRGLHVFVEKPIALTSSDVQAMVQAAERVQRILMVGYNARGMRSWRTIKQLLDAGAIGSVRQVNIACCIDGRLLWQTVEVAPHIQNLMDSSKLVGAFLGDALQPHSWRVALAKTGVGMFVEVGSHLLDLMLWLAGAKASEVVALGQPLGNGAASVVNLQGRLSNSATFSLAFNDHVSGGDFGFYGHGRLTLFGDEGLLTADWKGYMITEAQEIWLEHAGVREQVSPLPNIITPAAAFVATVLDGTSNLSPANEAAHVVALTEATYRAMAERRVVQVK